MHSLASHLEKYTASISNFETSRDYISLSHVAQESTDIINMFVDGFEDSLQIRLRCYKGYQMEKDLVERIETVFHDRVTFGEEISAFNGLVRGHPDFYFDGFPADCKSVPLEEHLPDGRLPRRVFWQMQGYMLYGNKPKALVFYEARETGAIREYWINPNANIQNQIHTKLIAVTGSVAVMARFNSIQKEKQSLKTTNL